MFHNESLSNFLFKVSVHGAEGASAELTRRGNWKQGNAVRQSMFSQKLKIRHNHVLF